MKYVLDSSVAFKWVVPETHTDKALLLRDDFRNGIHELIAPDVLPVEVAHALTRAERQNRITTSDAPRRLARVLRSLPALHPSVPLLTRACALSSTHRVGVYDCLYVALAEREGCGFVTGDDKLVRNLGPTFPFIRPLVSFP